MKPSARPALKSLDEIMVNRKTPCHASASKSSSIQFLISCGANCRIVSSDAHVFHMGYCDKVNANVSQFGHIGFGTSSSAQLTGYKHLVISLTIDGSTSF